MSVLDEIKARSRARHHDDPVTWYEADIAALLAVVDSTLDGNTPEYEAAVAQVTSELFGEGTKARAKYEARAAAWRALAEGLTWRLG